VRSGCCAGAGTGRAARRAKRYGDNLGLAFQIADDLLDAEGDAQAMGKATGKDSAAGKATLVGLIGVEDARAQLAAGPVVNAERELHQFGDKAGVLIEAAHSLPAARTDCQERHLKAEGASCRCRRRFTRRLK
jgi:farnesyl diphosphate synthase